MQGAGMNRHIIVEDEEISRLKRQKVFAYIASMISQVIAFTLGWLVSANWHRFVLFFQGNL